MYTVTFLINFYLIICVCSRILPIDVKLSYNTDRNDTNNSRDNDTSNDDETSIDDEDVGVYGAVFNDSEYGPIFLDNTTDREDLIKGPYKHEYQLEKLLSVTVPTSISFLVLIIFVCIICRPKTHFVSHFTRHRNELCRHQQRTHEAYRKKYALTPEEREQKRLAELKKEEERIEKMKERIRQRREKKLEKQHRESEKRHEARMEAQEKAKEKHLKRLQHLKSQREKDIKKKMKKKALLEVRRDEILEREGREPRIDRSRRSSKSLIYGSGKMLQDEDKFVREEMLRKGKVKEDELSTKSSERITFVDLRDKKHEDKTTRVRGPPRERHYTL